MLQHLTSWCWGPPSSGWCPCHPQGYTNTTKGPKDAPGSIKTPLHLRRLCWGPPSSGWRPCHPRGTPRRPWVHKDTAASKKSMLRSTKSRVWPVTPPRSTNTMEAPKMPPGSNMLPVGDKPTLTSRMILKKIYLSRNNSICVHFNFSKANVGFCILFL